MPATTSAAGTSVAGRGGIRREVVAAFVLHSAALAVIGYRGWS